MLNKPARCNKCGRLCAGNLIGTCKHPAVNSVFGNYICMYCCRGCKFHIQLTVETDGLCGVKCGYNNERSL